MEVYIVINETSCLEMRRKITTIQTWCRRSFAPVFYNPVGGAKCSGNGITWFKEYRGLYLILMNLRKFSWFMPFGEFNLTKGNCKVLCEQSFNSSKKHANCNAGVHYQNSVITTCLLLPYTKSKNIHPPSPRHKNNLFRPLEKKEAQKRRKHNQ